MRLARDQNFQGLHVGVPLDGVAVHINAFNFPAWGLWEKAAVSLLAGVPVLTKPATATAWLAQEMVSAVIEAGILPPGSLSILCGSPNDLLDHLRLGDVVAFTGSAETGAGVRQHPRIQQQGVRVNIEADSLNAALLGPDAAPGSPSFDFFVREVVREMTSKTGQKCTAIRRVLVPARARCGRDRCDTSGVEHGGGRQSGEPHGNHGSGGEYGAAKIGGRRNSPAERTGDRLRTGPSPLPRWMPAPSRGRSFLRRC